MLSMSIIVEKQQCPNCNGPIGSAGGSYRTCPYCASEFYLPPKKGYRIPADRPYPQPPTIGTCRVGDQRYLIHGRLGRGQHSDVYLAHSARALTQLVVLKIERVGGRVAVENEWSALRQIRARSEFLRHMTASPVGLAETDGKLTAVYRWRPGFSFTLVDAKREYPQGVDPRAAVWMWNRILDQLSCLEEIDWSHGALTPEHLLLHPRDHGVAFCGWSRAARVDGQDLRRSGAAIATLLGRNAPKPLIELAYHADCFEHAASLQQELRRIAESAFGPPRFHTFTLTGGQ